jgi:PAS domain S-box-containing protein
VTDSNGPKVGEERFRRLIHDLHVGVLVQGPNLEIRISNEAARQLLGLTEDQLHGRTSYDPAWKIFLEDGTPFPPERRPATTVLLTGRAVRNVVMGIDRPARKDRVWLLVDVEPEFGPGGEVVEVVSTLTDISERKRLEASLLRAQRLESIGRLAGGIAHDFNNLLTAILSYTRMAQQELPAGSRGRADLDETLAAADRAASLTRQLLTFASRQITMPKVIDVKDALAGVQKLLSKLIGEHVELDVAADPDCWPTLMDPAQLEQVLVNLAVNARDAMPGGGRLVIHASNAPDTGGAESRDGPAGDHVLIRVSDTGHGMDSETRLRVFDPFFTTKEVGQGTGLGLAIVHGVVERHGGRVSVESAPGQGTTFQVYLPRAQRTSPATGRPRASSAPGGHERILLVEDEAPVRRLAVRILEFQGYSVLPARNGDEALELVRSERDPIALVITDIVMPRMDGRALAQELRGLRPEIRVLLVSGYAADHGAIEGPFLGKPYTPDSLAKKVREVLDRPG